MSSLQQRATAEIARFPFPRQPQLRAGTMSQVEKPAARAAGPDLRSEHDEAARVLESIGSTLRFKRNEAIFSESDEAHHVYRVVSGATRSGRILLDGRRQIAGFGLPGDFLGLEWQPVHSVTVEAVTDVVIVSYPRSQIERLCDENPALRHEIMQLLMDGLSDSQARLVVLGRQTAVERLAWFLVRKARRTDASSGLLDLPMSRLDIADYLGLTIETVSRVISQLKKQHLISLPGAHQVKIDNLATLEAMAKGERAA